MSELDFLTIIWTLIALPISFGLALLGVEVWEFFTYRKR